MVKGCSVCPSYSRGLGRCKLGMINAKTYKGAVDAVKFMGISYICPWTDKSLKIKKKIIAERLEVKK